MQNLSLTRLAFFGSAVRSASIDFSSGLNVLFGASETGKSFVVDTIDYMLGGQRLRQIPQMAGYSTILLGIQLPDDRSVTLIRGIQARTNSIDVYEGTHSEAPLSAPILRLNAKHSSTSENNISRWLLATLGLDGRRLRKNDRNELVSLSFRNLARLCIVDETEIQSPTAPFLTGQFVSKTTEKAAIRLLLSGEDDSDLEATPDRAVDRQVSRGKTEVLDRAVGELRDSIQGSPTASQLANTMERLDASIAEATDGAKTVLAQRDGHLNTRAGLVQQIYDLRTRDSEILDLTARFSLLRAQYESDLERLDAVEEAGTALGFFTPGVCAFCGAATEHQQYNPHNIVETTRLADSVAAEREKTQILLADLLVTLTDLQTQRVEVLDQSGGLQEQSLAVDALIDEIDSDLASRNRDLQELFDARSRATRFLDAFAHIERLESLRGTLEITTAAKEKTEQPDSLGSSIAREYSAVIQDILREWGLPGAVRFDPATFDIFLDGQPRADRGKGVRSVLHAAANLGLAKYCFDRELPYPGFVVLDSPLITFRDPLGITLQEDEDEALDPTVAVAFFRYLEDFPVQVVVAENIDPPVPMNSNTSSTRFTGRNDSGRYGFFPVG